MPDFDAMKPEKTITNPRAAKAEKSGVPLDTQYPRHLHKWAGYESDGVTPKLNEYVTAQTADEEDRYRKAGWSLVPVLEPPDEPKAKGK